MLTEIEEGLVNAIAKSDLAKRLRAVDKLPDLDGDALVKKFAVDAPAVYVCLGDFPVTDGAAKVPASIACLVRNAGGHVQARQGDGKAIGLYFMIERVAAVMEGLNAGDTGWRVTRVRFMQEDTLFKAGLQCAIVQIESTGGVTLPPLLDEAALSAMGELETFNAQFDIPPHVPGSEHNDWLKEPPDYSASKPELIDTTQVKQGE